MRFFVMRQSYPSHPEVFAFYFRSNHLLVYNLSSTGHARLIVLRP